MNINIPLDTLLFVLLGVGGVILIVYLIVLVHNLNKTLKKADIVIEEAHTAIAEAHVVTEIAAKRAQEVDGIVDDVTTSVKAISDNLKGNISVAKIVAAVVNLATSIKGFVDKK